MGFVFLKNKQKGLMENEKTVAFGIEYRNVNDNVGIL